VKPRKNVWPTSKRIQLLLENAREEVFRLDPQARRLNLCWHETRALPAICRHTAACRSPKAAATPSAESADRRKEAISRHKKSKVLARSSAATSVPVPPGN